MPKKRTTNRDHAKRQQRPMMEDEAIATHLSDLVTPALITQEKYLRSLGMRDRILNLPLMIAAVLTLIWRDVAGVTELTRMLKCDTSLSVLFASTNIRSTNLNYRYRWFY